MAVFLVLCLEFRPRGSRSQAVTTHILSGPYEDRGTVEILKTAQGLSMKVIRTIRSCFSTSSP